MRSVDLVREFHDRFGVPNRDVPHVADEATNRLRVALLREELDELEAALAARDLVAALDALTDLQYVLDGAYLALGFAGVKDAALREVHRSNLSKLGEDGHPVRRADGKVLKGPRFEPPDLARVVAGVVGVSAHLEAGMPDEILEQAFESTCRHRDDLVRRCLALEKEVAALRARREGREE